MRKGMSFLIMVAMLIVSAGTAFAQTDTEQCTATGRNINLRAGPGTSYGAVGALNDSLPITGQDSDGTWYQVSYRDQTAWVAAHVVTTAGDCSAVPVATYREVTGAAAIEMEPFTCQAGNFRGVQPVGWTSIDNCGFRSAAFSAFLYQRAYEMPRMDVVYSIATSIANLSNDAMVSFEVVGVEDTEYLTWVHYEIPTAVQGNPIYFDVAITETEDEPVYAITLVSLDPRYREDLLDAVFRPAIAAFVPIGVTARNTNTEAAPVRYGPVTISNLSLNQNGTQVTVAPGESVAVTARYSYECRNCQQGSINQIIVGIAGIGAQTCIYNGSIQGSGSASFTLTAPGTPGTYSVRFRYAQAMNCASAVQNWWNVDQSPPVEAEIATIVVSGE